MADFDKIVTSTPVNAQAARQLSKGVDFAPDKNITNVFKAPPKMVDVTDEMRSNASFTDLTGYEVDRIKVIGPAYREGKSGSRSWVCRCKCGNYYVIKSKFILHGRTSGEPHMCTECDYTQYIKNGMK